MRRGDQHAETAAGGYAPGTAAEQPKRLPLFRPEALAAAGAQPFGSPFGKAPLSWSIIALFLAGVTAATGAFLVTARYARKETALGVLRAEGGETRIIAQSGGAVRALYVQEGEVVAQGQPLALIATEVMLPGGGVMDEAMLAGLSQEEATLTARLAALDASAPLEVQTLRAEQRRLNVERDAASQAVVSTEARLALARERLAAGEALAAQGYLPADQLRERQGAVIALEEALGRARADVASLSAQAAGVAARLAKLPHDLELTRAQLEAQAAGLTQQRAQLEGRRGYELRAQGGADHGAAGEPRPGGRSQQTLDDADARGRRPAGGALCALARHPLRQARAAGAAAV